MVGHTKEVCYKYMDIQLGTDNTKGIKIKATEMRGVLLTMFSLNLTLQEIIKAKKLLNREHNLNWIPSRPTE